jgi:CHAD domain-containing protein/CYTH domain-containing protein
MATFDPSLLEEPAPRGARMVALALLGDLAQEYERLKSNRDLDTLHDFRVALRRLRSWLGALRPTLRGSVPRGAARRLRRLAKASNAGRDAEVFLAWLKSVVPGLPSRDQAAARWLIARFERQQREADASLAELLDRDFARARERLALRLEQYTVVAHVHAGMQEPALAATLEGRLHDQGAALQERLGLIRSQDDERQVHRARIAGKRLRYLLEPVAAQVPGGDALVERLKVLQDALGDLHDAHLWLLMLREMAAEAAIEEGRRLARSLTNGSRVVERGDRYPSLTGFALLGRLAQQRASVAYLHFTREWGKRGARRFFKALDGARGFLARRGRPAVEIERKYLLTGLPRALPRVVTSQITQGYLPGRRFVERLRAERRGGRTRYYRTVKSGSGLVRAELEDETTRAVFEAMWPLTQGKRLTKLRHRVPQGKLVWEIDEFPENGLVLAELELPSPAAAVRFPPWLAPYVRREVTGEPAFLNVNLAK